MTTIQRNYEIVKFVLSTDTIDKFEIIHDRRMVSDTHVGRIHGALMSGKNPVGVLIVNRRNEKLRLIDGNHRFEAVKRYLNRKNDIKVECVLKVYEKLTDEQEREVYADEARRRNESYEDRLNMYKQVLTFYKLLVDESNHFPCKVSIYSAVDSIRLRTILNAFNTVIRESGSGYYPKYLGKEEIVKFALDLKYDDFILLKEFMTFFIRCYGNVGRSNMFSYTHYFIPLFDIYHKNIMYKDEKNFEERFKAILGRAEMIRFSRTATREAQCRIREMMLERMNHGFKTHLFV